MDLGFTNNDLVFSYKLTHFTGFAPCMCNDELSLACCKGNKKNGGMRVSISKKIDNPSKKNIWILGIAGKFLNKYSVIEYDGGNVVYLAKITNEENVLTLKEYREKCVSSPRRDNIYCLEGGIIVRKGGCFSDDHKCKDVCESEDNDYLPKDCSLFYYGESSAHNQKRVFDELKQIIVTKEYWIFEKGVKCPEILDVKRGYAYKEKESNSRVECLVQFFEENYDRVLDIKNPFVKCDRCR